MEIPDRWNAILDDIKAAGFPEAVIAGGAMRDLWHGVPHKDIDVFVRARRDTGGMQRVVMQLGAIFGTPTAQLVDAPDYLGWNPEVTGYVNFRLHDEDVQIVGVDARPFTTDFVLRRIDFGICQIGWDGQTLTTTEAFRDDARNKTFTINRSDNDNDEARTLKRFERISLRYPEHRLVRPQPDPVFSIFGG